MAIFVRITKPGFVQKLLFKNRYCRFLYKFFLFLLAITYHTNGPKFKALCEIKIFIILKSVIFGIGVVVFAILSNEDRRLFYYFSIRFHFQ